MSAKTAMSRSAEAVAEYGVPAGSPRAVKLSAAQLDSEGVVTLDAIHARAETVTTVLESILHSQPVLPFNLR